MILFLASLLTLIAQAETPELPTQQPAVVTPASAPSAAPTAAAPAASESSDYEVDYEEEPGGEEIEEPVEVKPTPSKGKKGKAKDKKNPKESISQGSRAEKKIAPLMKSETKSIYKKNGKPLDVDSD